MASVLHSCGLGSGIMVGTAGNGRAETIPLGDTFGLLEGHHIAYVRLMVRAPRAAPSDGDDLVCLLLSLFCSLTIHITYTHSFLLLLVHTS